MENTPTSRDETLDRWCIGIIVLVATGLAWYFHAGLFCSDDTRYLIGIIKVASGHDIAVASLAERRLFLLLPGAAVYRLTDSVGVTVASYAAFYVALGVAGFLVARLLFPRAVALACALAAVAQPTLFLYSGTVVPDIAPALFLLVALGIFCRWALQGLNDSYAGKALPLAMGVAIGLATTLKESSVIMLGIPLAWLGLMTIRERWRPVSIAGVCLLAGVVAVLIVEALAFRALAGQWHSSLVSLLEADDFTKYLADQGHTPLERLVTLNGLMGPQTSFLYLLALVSTLLLLAERASGRLSVKEWGAWFGVAGFWALPTFYFTWGTSSLVEYVPPLMQQRYYAPCIVPAALLTARLFWRAGQAPWAAARATGATLGAACFLVVMAAPYSERVDRGDIYGVYHKEALTLALHDAERRFPGLPIVDSDSGALADHRRCRLLLMRDLEGGRHRLEQALPFRRDLEYEFRPPGLDELRPPFLVLGHGPLSSNETVASWLPELTRLVEQDDVEVEHVARHHGVSEQRMRDTWWLPRTSMPRRIMKLGYEPDPSSIPTSSERDPFVHDSVVDVYLVKESEAAGTEQEPVSAHQLD